MRRREAFTGLSFACGRQSSFHRDAKSASDAPAGLARRAARHAILVLATLIFAGSPYSRTEAAPQTVIAGAVSSGSTNLWPIFIAMKTGLFAAQDIKVDLVFAQSNASVIQQLAAGSLNVSVGSGLVDPIRAIDRGAPIALARIETQKPPYELMAKPAIKTMADLKGKIVSVGGAKDITRIFFERMLASRGVAAHDVDLIFAGATSARMAALLSGAADAALLTTPYNFHAEAAGYTSLGLTAETVDLPFSGVSINRNWAAAHMRTMQNYLAAYSHAILWLEQPANRQAAVDMMIAASSLKADEVEKAYDFLIGGHFFETTGRISRARLGSIVAVLKELGDLPAAIPVERLVLPGLAQVTE